ncbi:hypothetical protein SERLA73DRAFT_167275 [Serpula lacrymans var. lacrymans S7.3]|uniref:Clavaminate synthase-like protein n=2 Tax=Serpula lacrymans var. lacrymans TaxID=341189 RepID=F8PRJ9_SERL3|nr:uncharacterized protein SERLADRAFT_447901 [Serpula lacrymans var. lacrymans S7.9]EGO01138.1 hypothetical protein SERLA73DRAFT_167275 [Serpula lacrymans var. lacrymans S7.3]EGO26787.1 hypothetical protein SERLADRAFT_447901 [Serpula lacrymans var. lacrymans S7.9]
MSRGRNTDFMVSWNSKPVDEKEISVRSLRTKFPHIWLRDSCQCPSCVHTSTLQKLHRTSDISSDMHPVPNGVTTTHEGVHVKWKDGHESIYHYSFLERHSSSAALSRYHKDQETKMWDGQSIAKTDNLFLPYDSLRNTSSLLSAITQLTQFGLLFVTGVPNHEHDNQTCELRRLANTFGELRETFYGELWDVKNVRNSRNIAYTNLNLDLHMDLLYFQHPPRYQILHCLRNRVLGGTSVFVDAFHVASTLRSSNPADFDTLANTPVPFHYVNDGHHLHFEHPTIELASPSPATSSPNSSLDASTQDKIQIQHINYSPPFQAPLLLHSTPPTFYPALKRFATLLDDPINRFEYTLREGDAVLFDNRRVLHARTAFSNPEDNNSEKDGEPNRWLKGCYLEADAILDRARVMRTSAEVNSTKIE